MSSKRGPTVNTVKTEKQRKILIIRFDNPKKKNALSREAYKLITKFLEDAATDDSITTVILTGEGDFYSSGNDISATMSGGFDREDIDEVLREAQKILRDLIRTIFTFPKLLIALVNGPCIGIAATTAALCDVVYCSKSAYFYTPFTLLGLCPEGCSSYTFPRILGSSKANEMLLLNHKLSAEEALKFKFVSEIYKNDNELNVIWKKIRHFSELPPESLLIGKKLIKKPQLEHLEKAMNSELDLISERWKSEEFFTAAISFMSRSKSKL